MNRAASGKAASGFTVLEVMVALAIAIGSVTVLYGAIADAMRTARSTEAAQQAVSRALSRLASLDDPADALGERDGDDGGGFRWRTQVRMAGSATAAHTGRASVWARGTGLYQVTVAISWRDGRADRSVALNGAVLGPLPHAPN